jgi:hypothetical protein
MAKKKGGIYADAKNTPINNAQDKVLDFSYENDVLAQLIVDLWLNPHSTLIHPSGQGTTAAQYAARSTAAQAALKARGIYLEQPIVITEEEYDTGFLLRDYNFDPDVAVVFVLPRDSRPTTTAGTPLLETAKMLMAITPNGI